MRLLYFDCFSGAAGDMILGALIDAGVPIGDVRQALGTLAIGPEAVWTERVQRAGLSATKFCVVGEDEPHDHAHDEDHRGGEGESGHTQHGLGGAGHSHEDGQGHTHTHSHTHTHTHPHHHGGAAQADESVHHHHGHRTLDEIYRLIDRSALSGAGRDRAKALFHRLGEAESAVHGVPLEKVHLHEVGALDSIVDIVGTVFAIDALGVDRIVSSPLNVGSGSIRSAHGLYPVPAPATLRLLTDAPVYSGPQTAELVTPTGALLITHYASSYGTIPAMRIQQSGYGAGTRDFADSPNVLRVLLGEAEAAAPAHAVVVMEAEIDDMNPQIFGLLMERLLAEGALDVFYTSIQMKKNRPGTLLSVVATPDARERLTAIVFRETTTIGVRYREMMRECLDRELLTVQTPLGPVRMKIARRNGALLNASPEFDDCARLATESGRPLKDVQAAAMKAFLDTRDL